MDKRPIGIFDSGIGGLTSVKEFKKILPNEDIVYFGDTARLPYGTRSRETIIKYAMQDIKFLLSKDVKMIIAACGTVSSVLPASALQEIDFLYSNVLTPAVQAACAITNSGKIGVIGTCATIRSGAYGKAIRTIRSDATIIGNSCPLFVPLVENGYTALDNTVARLVAQEYLAPFQNGAVDTLILGCTHYGIIYDLINDVLGGKVNLIIPGAEAAHHAQTVLTTREMLNDSGGKATYYVSDSVELFGENAKAFLGENFNEKAECVSVDSL